MGEARSTLGLHRFFAAAFHIHPEEFNLVQAFFGYLVLIGIFSSLGETVGQTLFLSRLGGERVLRFLPWNYIAIAATSAVVTFLYGIAQERVSRIALIIGTQLSLAASLVIYREAISRSWSWAYISLIIWIKVCELVLVALFFSFAGDYFTGRKAKRLYPYILGGAALGTLLGGYGVEPLVGLAGTENLLYVCAAMLAVTAAICFGISRNVKALGGAFESDAQSQEAEPLRTLLANSYLRLIFAAILAGLICSTLVDYEMNILASRQFSETELAVFFGKFFAIFGAASIIIQFLVVGRVLARLGIILSLLIWPCLLIAGRSGYLFFPSLLLAAGISLMCQTLQQTLDSPARELLFLPLQRRLRLRAQALAGGALIPIGTALGGLILLLAGPHPNSRHLTLILLAVAAAWVVAILRLRPQYHETLAASLRRLRFLPSDIGAQLRRKENAAVLGELLRADNPALVAEALEILRGRPLGFFSGRVAELAASAATPIAAAAVELLGEEPTKAHFEVIRQALLDPRSEVKSAAARAFCRIEGEQAVSEVSRWISDAEPSIRGAALVGCARYGADIGARLAQERLDAGLASKNPQDRAEVVGLLAQIGGPLASRALQRALLDLDRGVRREAIAAVGRLGDPNFTARLLDSLGDPKLRPLTMSVLDSMPREAVPQIIDFIRCVPPIADPVYLLRVLLPERTILARVLGSIGGSEAAGALWELIGPKEHLVLRVTASHALRRIQKRDGLNLSLSGLEGLRQSLCGDIWSSQNVARRIAHDDPLKGALFNDFAKVQIELLLNFLSLEFELDQIRQIEAGIFGGNETLRSNALELLEVSLPRAVAERVLPLLAPEDDDGEVVLISQEKLGLLLKGDPWIRCITLFYLAKGAVLPELIGGEKMSAHDKSLYKVVTTISFLKQVSLFADVPASYLASLAEIASEKTVRAGETLFLQGDKGDCLYLICEGRVKILLGDREVAQLASRECLGETSVLDGLPRSASVVAVENTRLLRIAADDFADLITIQPGITKPLLLTMARRERELLAQIQGAGVKS